MGGRAKKVHFSESEPLKYRQVVIPFGQKSLLHLSIEVTPYELKRLDQITKELHALHFKVIRSHEDTIKYFIKQIRHLLKLNCMLRHQECIKTSTRNLFLQLIYDMPNHAIRPGCPGYNHYIKELEYIDQTIKMINLELNKIHVVNTCTSRLSIQDPSTCNRFEFNFDGLPRNLTEFIRSIDVNMPRRLFEWGEHFRTHSIDTLSMYLADVTTAIQQLTDDKEVNYIIQHIKKFIHKFKKSGYDLQIEMFSDVASDGNRSPLSSPNQEHMIILNEHLDKLLSSTQTDFDQNFCAFRQELSRAKNAPHVEFNMLLQKLNHYLVEKKTSPPPSTIKTVQGYISRCISRLEKPLPKHLQCMLDELLFEYDDEHNQPFSQRTRYKFEFLTALSDNINIHSEKTYAECYCLTKDASTVEIQALLNGKRWLFFNQHRFKNFINSLLAEEPDYGVESNNLLHEDVSCFPC